MSRKKTALPRKNTTPEGYINPDKKHQVTISGTPELQEWFYSLCDASLRNSYWALQFIRLYEVIYLSWISNPEWLVIPSPDMYSNINTTISGTELILLHSIADCKSHRNGHSYHMRRAMYAYHKMQSLDIKGFTLKDFNLYTLTGGKNPNPEDRYRLFELLREAKLDLVS